MGHMVAARQEGPRERFWIDVRDYQGHLFVDIQRHFVSKANTRRLARRA
jgi:hypothetical protein